MSSRPLRRGFVACYIAAVFLLSTGVVFATENSEVRTPSPWCQMAGWLVQPFGFCQPQAQTSIVPESAPTALTYADLSQLLPPTPEVAGASTSVVYETNYVTLSSAGVSQAELTSRIHKLILYINLRDELTKYNRVSEDVYPSKAASRNPAELVTKGYLWESLDRVNDRISDSDGGGGATNNITNNYSTTTNATGDIAADTVTLGTTTSLSQLTLTEDIYLGNFIPGATVNRLYNSGGVLYWNGNSITGSSTGNNWAENGSDVYRMSGNVGIGSSTPSSKLTVIGNGYFGGNVTGTGALTIAGLASFQNASTSNLSITGRLYDSSNAAGALGMILQTTGTSTRWVATSSLGFAGGASTYLALTDTINSYTANRIQFTNASGTALTDSSNLVFTGSRLGVGTTTPGNTLTVAGDIGATSIKAEVYDMGGHVCNVEAYGAVGDNSTLNDAAIAAAIADCALDGGTVLFPMGQFRISTPIVLDAPVTLMGTYAPRWSYASTPRSSIRAAFGTFVGSAIIHVRDQSISGAPSANNGGRLVNLSVDGGSYGSNIHGLYFEGLVRDWKVVDVDVSQTSGDGFLAEVGTGSGNPRGFTIKGLSIYSAASHGFRATALNDSYLEDIVTVGNALRGFYLSSMGETKIVGSRAVFNALEGLYIDGASSNGGLQFTDFSTDRNDRHGVRISATGTTTITFNGLLTRRDGPNDGGGTETPYAGLAVIGSSTAQVAPVIVTNLSQIIGVDDDGTGTKAPLVGVRVTNAAYVRVNGQLWGTTNAFVDGGGNGHFVIDEESIIKSGNEWTGITPVLYNNKWVATTTGLLYASGTVTIGSTPTTTRLLNIIASNNPGARFTDTTNNVMLDMRAEDSQAFIGTFTNHQLRFQTNNTSRLTIDTNGRVGIGTTSPATELAVVGSAYFTGALRDSSNTAGTLGMVLQTTGSGTQWVATSSLGFAAGASTYLALTDTPSSFSANRIPFTNASATALTDSSNFTFDGSNLGLGGQQGIAFGGTRYLYASSTNDSITFGENAGSALLGDGLDNILIGLESGHLLTTADYNVALGTYSLRNATSSSRNIAIGEQALEALTGGDNNVAIGYKVGESLTSGVHNVGVGNFALFSAVSGSFNTGVGHSALSELIDGTYNSAFGENAGEHLATGTLNVLAGYGAAQDATNTSNSVIIGAQAAQGLGASVLTWQNNTIIGYRAGRAINGSSNNTIIGYRAADSLTTGANNIVIGYDVEAASNTASNQLNIGNLVFSNGIDGIGTTLSSGNLGIGTTTPINKLDVFGTGAGPSASGAASNGVLRIGATGLTRALDMGVSSGANVYSWIQSRSATSYGSNFSLALNPNGGNVGVGTSSPATSLHIDAANVGNGILTSQANFVITSNNAQAADRGGSLGFGGIYTSASDQRLFAGISGRKENSTGANQAGYLSFYTNNNSTLAEVMRINSSGNVGVGTTSPSSKLDVWGDFRVGTSTTPLLFADTTTGFVGVGTASPSYPLQVNGNVAGAFNAFALYNANGGLGSSAVLRFVNSSGGGATSTSNAQIAGIRTGNSPGTTALSFSTSDGTTVSEKMRIDSVGNVAIGTTSPAYRFEVYGHAGLNTPFVGLGGTSTDSGSTLYVYRYRNSSSTDSPLVDFIQSNASDDQVALRIKQDGTGNIISALSNNTEVFSLTATGNLGLGTTSPLAKLSVSGNTFIQGNLTATGTLTVSGTTSLAAASSSALSLTGYLYDSARSGGTLGMVLQSTGTSTRWVATSTLGISGSSFTNSAQLAALLSDETGTGFSVFGTSPAFAGIATFSGLTASSTLTLSGTAANIALGSNYLSGDGDDEGVYVGSTGNVGIGTTSPSSKLDVVGSVKASVSFISSLYTSATGSTISLHPGAAPTDISDGNMLSLVGGDAGSTLGVGGAVSITGGAGNANGYAGGLIDITGGTGNYNAPGGAVTIQGGEGIGGGGGALSLYGGDESNAGSGGTVNIKGGLSRGNGFDGGAVNISAGDASALVSDGGVLTLSGGSAVGNVGNGGDVVIAAGSGIGGGVSGDIVLMGGKVGIGTTTPWSALTVVGGISSPDRANVVANEAFGRDAFIVSGTGYANTVLGAYAGVNSSYSQENVVIGAYASSTKSYNVLIGANAYNDGDASVVIGANVTNTSGSSVLIGNSSGVSNDGLIALGFGNGAAAANSMAFGWGMYADEADSIVFGSRRTASTSPSFKLVGATDQYNAQDLFKIDTSWIDDTNVSRKGRTILSVFDTAERQFLQADATGSGVNVSFNGGNVGIGTTSPNAKLMVGNGTETGAQWIRNFGSVSDIWIGQSAFTHFGFAPGTAALMMQDSGRNFPLVVGNVNSKPLIFGTSNLERMRISADGSVGIGTTDTSNGTLVVNGGISGDTLYLPGTNTVTFTTPGNAPVPTKINIPFFDPGNFGQVMALGISSSSLNTSRVLSLFDDRRTAHQPTIGIFSPDENNLIGFSWEGSNSTSYLKTTSGNVAIRSSNYDIATFVESTGNVGIGTTTPGTKLAIAQSVDYSGLSIFGYDDMANTSADLSVGSGGEFAIGASTGGGFLAGVGGTYVASWNDNKLSVLDNVEFITGTDDDYSLGYHSASDTFRIVDGNDLASNVRLTMNSTGNIGIGTTSPSAKLDVWGSLVVGTSSTPLIWADVLDQVVMIGTSTNQVGVGGLTVAGDIFSDGFRTADAHSFGWGDFSSQIYGSSAGSDYISLYSGGQDRLWINGTTGNVGIGTTTPSYQLSIAGTSGELLQVANPGVTDARMLFQNSTSGFGTGNGIVLGINSSGAGTIWNYENRSIFFGTNDTERMRILSTGEVGIGTTTPSAQLTTTGTVRFANFGAGTLQTDASGNLSVSSDERLKDLQGMYTAGLNEILLIDPITYKWNEESGLETETTYAGFSAQNVLAALPEAVGESPNGFLTLSDRPILAAVVNAIKEIWEKVTGQQEKIDELEARIEALEAEQGIDAPAPEPEPEPDPAPQITPEPEPEVVVPPPEPTPEPEIVPESEPDPVPEPEVAP